MHVEERAERVVATAGNTCVAEMFYFSPSFCVKARYVCHGKNSNIRVLPAVAALQQCNPDGALQCYCQAF